MPTETQRDLYRILRDAQDKYVYFLLTAAGAAIALAVNSTQGATMQWSQLPLGAAVLCWALSFYFGCRQIAYVNSTLYSNAEMLRIQAGEHPLTGQHPGMIEAASAGIRQAMESNAERISLLGNLQFRLLVGGGVLYVVWHVVGMYLRTRP
jgi:hypothetical protein